MIFVAIGSLRVNPFKPNGTFQLDKSISVLWFFGWSFSF